MTPALTFELPVDHHLFWGNSEARASNTYHIPGGLTAVPEGEEEWSEERERERKRE